jgi:hypothetical protein
VKTILKDSPTTLLAPPIIPNENQAGDWFPLPKPDLITDHITAILWDKEVAPEKWQTAQLSPLVYIYQEKGSGWKVVAKFHASKTEKNAINHAEREHSLTQQAWECLGSERELRSVQPLGLWKGVLFFEFVEGITLEDEIAIRHSQPGGLILLIETVGKLLSKIHMTGRQEKNTPDFGQAADYAHMLVDYLAKNGVLQNHPSVQTELGHLIEKWGTDSVMWNYEQTLIHGDASVSNFIFPPDGGVVAIDWDCSEAADPAADLGRLMAELTHSVNQYGGNFTEGLDISNALAAAYCNQMSSNWDTESLVYRARFYQAIGTLRIARNNRLSRQDRLALVLRAFALLSK